MRMFIGHAPNPAAVTPSPISARTAEMAEARIESNAARSVARHALAMSVDGISYVLWRYVPRAGHLCTCSLDDRAPPAPLPLPVSNGPVDLSPAEPAAPPSTAGRTTFRQVRGSTPFYRTPLDAELAEATEQLEGEEYLASYNDLDHLRPPATDVAPATSTGEFSELSHIFGGELQRCGICFGSRYEAGYQLQCGTRVLLTSRSNYTYTGAVTLDRSATPHSFQIESGGAITWPVTSQLGTLAVWGLAALNNLEPAANTTLEYSTDGGQTWAALLAGAVPTDGTAYNLRARQTNLAHPAVLTHVEYHAQTVELPQMQMPLYSDETNADVFESLSTTNIELTAGVAPVGKQSYLLEMKYHRMWRLNDVETKETAAGTVYSLECNARAVQLSEQIYQLARLYNR